MKYKELIDTLRSIKSRSKAALLNEAADTIEALVGDLRRSSHLDPCQLCAHGQTPAPCEQADYDCEYCTLDCICRDCRGEEQWVWRGLTQMKE